MDDKERKEEEDTDTNIRRRRGKLMNNKVDPDIPLFPWKKRYCLESASVFQPLFVKDDLSQLLLLHSLRELHKGPSWMTRRERRTTTLVPTLGGGEIGW